MKKTHLIWSHRLCYVLLACCLTLSFMTPISFAWENTPQVNAVNVVVGDVEMVVPDESIELELNVGKVKIPSSFLYGNILYLPLPLLIECGMDFDFPEEPQNENDLTVIINSMDHTQAAPLLLRTENDGKTSLDTPTYPYLFHIVVNGKDFASTEENFEFQDELIPPIIWKANTLYFPIEPILQALGIPAYWKEDPLTFIIGNTPQEEKVIGLKNFEKKNRYLSNQFSDIPSSTWYTAQVQAAFEYGLMVGTNGSSFNPSGNISIAEAITISSRLHNTYYANDYEFQGQTPWYQPYVDYALENKIIDGAYMNYDTPISRSEFAYIIAKAFPLPSINEVEDGAIPDITAESDYYEAVYLLYRAGIISGTDSIGTFNPNANITRAEVAVILSSMVDEALRKQFTLNTPVYPTALRMLEYWLVPIGDTWTIPIFIDPADADRSRTITWQSSDTTVAEIDSNGTITGKSMGLAQITATTENGISASCTVFVQSQEDIDIQYAKYALDKLKKQLKFPDTAEIYNIWVYSYPSSGVNKISVSIYYSAMTPLGLQRRGEYTAYYTMNSFSFITDDFEDGVSTHYSVERVIDINKVLAE